MSITPQTHAISRNPATGEVIDSYAFESAEALEQSLARAAQGYVTWKRTPLQQRAAVRPVRLGQALRSHADALAATITAEMGKPITQARGEMEKWKSGKVCRPVRLVRRQRPADARPGTDHRRARARLDRIPPAGPYPRGDNFPIWQVLRGAVPALLAGNTYVLKHAPNVMGSAYGMLLAFQQADFPAGVFEVINVDNDLVSQAIRDDRIVTGSVRAGSAIGSHAGAALKK